VTSDMTVNSPWLDTQEAAAYLKAKAGTLKNWRHRGEGPRYRVINRRLVRYHKSDLDAFAVGQAELLT
jgi:excisionase family DNA binding protein